MIVLHFFFLLFFFFGANVPDKRDSTVSDPCQGTLVSDYC